MTSHTTRYMTMKLYRSLSVSCALTLGVCSLLQTQTAHAQAAGSAAEEPKIDVQTFWPSGGPTATLALRSSDILEHLGFGFSLFANHSVRPLVYQAVNNPQSVRYGVDQLFTVDFLWAFALFDRLQIMAALPMVVAQSGEGITPIANNGAAGALSLIALRDARLDLALQVLRRPRRTFANGAGLRVDFGVTLPIGDARFQGSATAQLRPMIVADYQYAGFSVTANIGARIGFESRTYAFAWFGPRLETSLGIAYRPRPLSRLSIAADGQLLIPLDGPPSPLAGEIAATAQMQGELFTGLKYAVDRGRDVEVFLGAGIPLTSAVGVPLVRGLVGLSFTPRGIDDDGDHVRDAVDQCPDQPEDIDGFRDADGCPDLDNDGDRINDDVDRCANAPEDVDNFEDTDGCPEPDNDHDGINDPEDRCADEASGEHPDPDANGCPIRDRDGDDVLDADDQCPDQAVGTRADPDRRGCPLPDRDQDGVGDADDACPSDPRGEIHDRFRAGCPDPDRDHDGVLNEIDQCVNEAETINGVTDADGCPDAGEEQVTLGRLALLFNNVVRLSPRTRRLTPAQLAVLAQAAAKLKTLGPELGSVVVSIAPDRSRLGPVNALRLANLVVDGLVAGGLSRNIIQARSLELTGSAAPPGELRINITRNAPLVR